MPQKYHLSENGPKKCDAHIRHCPVGGAHFDSKEEAQHSFELEMGQSVGLLSKLRRTQAIDPYTRHVHVAEKRIQAEEATMKLRDARQQGGTVEQQFLAEGVLTEKELEQRYAREINHREAGISYMKGEEGDARIMGLTYSGDFKSEEEYGTAAISKRLNSGEGKPEEVLAFEHKGYKVFAILGEGRHGSFSADLEDRYNPVARSLEEAVRRADGYKAWDNQRASWKYDRKSAAEVKEKFIETFPGVKPPRTKAEMVGLLVREEVGDYTTPAIGEFQTGQALVVVTKDPAEARLFEKLKEAADTGNLRLGSSSNPFSRGAMFYDDRDVSRASREKIIRGEEARKAAKVYVAPLKSKLQEKGGLYAVSPRVDGTLKDVRDAKYILNFYPKDRRDDVWGIYNKQELELIAEGRYEEVPSIVERDKKREEERAKDAAKKRR